MIRGGLTRAGRGGVSASVVSVIASGTQDLQVTFSPAVTAFVNIGFFEAFDGSVWVPAVSSSPLGGGVYNLTMSTVGALFGGTPWRVNAELALSLGGKPVKTKLPQSGVSD